jgi:hypothetical protein
MPKVDNLMYLLKTSHGATRKTIDGVSEEESLVSIPGNPNTIRWITGHIVVSAVPQGKVLGVNLTLPEGWERMFDRGAEPSPDTSIYPSMQSLVSTLDQFHAAIQTGAAGLSDDQLDAEKELAPGWKGSAMNLANFFCIHEFYHAGQIALIRRTLGKTRLFG